MKTIHGLREQLAKAASISEIDSLLQKCEIYKEATIDTKRRWINTARKRAGELEANDVVAERSENFKKTKKNDNRRKN
jgi:hypothetical protein